MDDVLIESYQKVALGLISLLFYMRIVVNSSDIGLVCLMGKTFGPLYRALCLAACCRFEGCRLRLAVIVK